MQRCCVALLLTSSLLLSFGLAKNEKGRIRDVLAATLCKAMTFYRKSSKIVELLKENNQFSVELNSTKGSNGACRDLIWRNCAADCPKFSYAPCKTQSKAIIPRRPQSRIVNGVVAEPNEFPFLVRLNPFPEYDKPHCGGSIYNENWVVTAGHCIADIQLIAGKDAVLKVIAGDHSRSANSSTEQLRIVERTIIHESYIPFVYANDIALIKISPSFQFNEYVQPIPLVSISSDTTETGPTKNSLLKFTVAGWGTLQEYDTAGDAPDILQKVDVRIVPNEECQKLLEGRYYLTEKHVCAAPAAPPPQIGGACHGDSGGPLFATYKNGSRALVGVVSNSYGCGTQESPTVYTRAAQYTEWITRNVNELSATTPEDEC